MNTQEVLAVVAGEKITNADLDAFLQTVPKEQRLYASDPQFRGQYLEQLIAFRSFAKYGEDMKLDETEEFKKIMENMKREVLAQLAINTSLKDVTASDQEAVQYYEANKKRFEKGATVHAKHILVNEEKECQDIYNAIKNGDIAFEDAAKASSTCPSKAQGGDLGKFGRGQMFKEFEDTAFSAEIGVVVGPVKTQFGYHLIKVVDKHEAGAMPFDAVKGQIMNTLVQQKQNQVYTAKLNELKEKYVEK